MIFGFIYYTLFVYKVHFGLFFSFILLQSCKSFRHLKNLFYLITALFLSPFAKFPLSIWRSFAGLLFCFCHYKPPHIFFVSVFFFQILVFQFLSFLFFSFLPWLILYLTFFFFFRAVSLQVCLFSFRGAFSSSGVHFSFRCIFSTSGVPIPFQVWLFSIICAFSASLPLPLLSI